MLSGIAIGAVAIAFVALLALVWFFRAGEKTARRRLHILGEIARVAEGGRSLEETLDGIAEILVPELADFCTVDVIEANGIRRVAVRVTGPDAAEIETDLMARTPKLQQQMASAGSGSRQEPRLFERVSEGDMRAVAADDEDFAFLVRLGVRSALAVELRARGKPTGMLSIGVSHSGRRFRQDDARFASILAGRVALALDNAGLFSDLERIERERAEIAETLQRGLLPPPLPHIPGWAVAAMYRPAGAENEIGGDFYDAFRIAGGWMVVIGDVTGRGAKAASVTAHARYTLRTAAALTADPVVALETLNRELLARHGATLCSVAALAIDEDPSRPVRLAVAGHPAPLLIDGDSVTEASASAPVLGAFRDVAWGVQNTEVRARAAAGCRHRRRHRRGRERGPIRRAPAARRARRREQPRDRHPEAGGRAARLHRRRPRRRRRDHRVAPASAAVDLASEQDRALLERLFEAFNLRDAAEIAAVCDEGMEFFPVGTAEALGRTAPYVGPKGLHEYLDDVEKAWEELRISPKSVERRGESLLVRGRVYARSRELGIRDMPIAWIWEVGDGRFVRGEVFIDPEQAVLRLAASA